MISIHVPTRGTTFPLTAAIPCSYNFNPRSHKGNDILSFFFAVSIPYFNPRSHKGNDLLMLCNPYITIISIHVPTRGTTIDIIQFYFRNKFQSTFPQGERHQGRHVLIPEGEFQSTFPQGERPKGLIDNMYVKWFQSTFPQGERRRWYWTLRIRFWFQSTFPQGERLYSAVSPAIEDLFQSTFPQGERLITQKGS